MPAYLVAGEKEPFPPILLLENSYEVPVAIRVKKVAALQFKTQLKASCLRDVYLASDVITK